MAAPAKPKIDPADIWVHADCFYQTLALLCNVDPYNAQLAITVAQPTMVVGALTIELFLKCLICIETGSVQRGHDLKELFDLLRPQTQSRVQREWDTLILPFRAPEWDTTEKQLGVTIARDLPSALSAGSEAFEKIRYSYENENENLQYYLQDLPRILGRVILELKPEWKTLRRIAEPLEPPAHHSNPALDVQNGP
jgi:hypothetical protein